MSRRIPAVLNNEDGVYIHASLYNRVKQEYHQTLAELRELRHELNVANNKLRLLSMKQSNSSSRFWGKK